MAHSKMYWVKRTSKSSGTSAQVIDTDAMSMDVCLDILYDRINKQSASDSVSLQEMSAADVREYTKQIIADYITKERPAVKGYVTSAGLELKKLAVALENEILDWGCLTDAMNDETISEIQGNDYKSIYVERKGVTEPYRNKITGKLITFKSPEDMQAVANKLLKASEVSLSRNFALQGGMTLEGYRVAAVDSSVAAPDKGDNAHEVKSPMFVIRKFSKHKYTLNDLIAFGSMSHQMARYIKVLAKAGLSVIVAGATGSGKTVLLQCLLDLRNKNKRTAVVEDQSELSAHFRDANGCDTSNTFQFEAKPVPPNSEVALSYPSFENIITQLLRMTPRIITLGEMRTSSIINLAMTAADTGHTLYTTIHAKSVRDCISRIAKAVQTEMPTIPYDIILETICRAVPFMLSQQRLDDGSRKLLEVSEIVGVHTVNGKVEPHINTLFKFVPDGQGLHSDGKIHGNYVQVGRVSEGMREELALKALTKEELQILTEGPAAGESGVVGTFEPIDLR